MKGSDTRCQAPFFVVRICTYGNGRFREAKHGHGLGFARVAFGLSPLVSSWCKQRCKRESVASASLQGSGLLSGVAGLGVER